MIPTNIDSDMTKQAADNGGTEVDRKVKSDYDEALHKSTVTSPMFCEIKDKETDGTGLSMKPSALFVPSIV